MPASSNVFDVDPRLAAARQPANGEPNMDDERALKLAIELTYLQFQNRDGPLDAAAVDDSNGGMSPQGFENGSKERRSQNMTECVAVPSSEHVAEIVGRQGCKIKALRAKTNTYIKTPVRGEEPIFVVTGRKEDVFSAKREILSAAEHFSQIRACRKNNLNGSMAPGPPTNIPGQVTSQVRVPYRVVGLVVGPKGATIKRIQQQTHTYIVTPSRDKEPVFEVTGLPDNVDQARKEIESHIALRTGSAGENEDAASAAISPRHALSYNENTNYDMLNTSTHEALKGLYSSSLAASATNQLGINSLANLPAITNHYNALTSGLTAGINQQTNYAFNHPTAQAHQMPEFGTVMTNNKHASFFSDSRYMPLECNMPPMAAALKSSAPKKPKYIEKNLFRYTPDPNYPDLRFDPMLQPIAKSAGGDHLPPLHTGSDEGIGSSTGSSPSFENQQSSNIWGDLGRSMNAVTYGAALQSSASSIGSFANDTRRSSTGSTITPAAVHDHLRETMHSYNPNFGYQPAAPFAANPPQAESPNSNPELSSLLGNLSVNHHGAIGSAVNSTSSSPTTDQARKCHVCHDSAVTAALIPCGHHYFCMDCANSVSAEGGQCPVCQVRSTSALKLVN